MSPLAYLATAAGLSLGGFDPGPLLIAAVFMAARPPTDAAAARGVRRSVLAFGLVLLSGTFAWGLVLSLLVGEDLARVPWVHLLRTGWWIAALELAAAVALVVWAVLKRRNRNAPEKPPKNRSAAGLLLVAVGFVAIVTTDPPFIVLVGLSGTQPLWAVVAGHVVWTVISQLPLFLLVLAVLANRHRKVAQVIGGWWDRIRPALGVALPVLAVLAALALAADALEYLLAGHYLLDPAVLERVMG